eukprot:6419076-Pyramimonas_sp.AAC.1
MGGGDASGHRNWSFPWRSQWGHETCERCAETDGVAWTHVGIAAAGFGGAPNGATERVSGVPTRVAWTHYVGTTTVDF